MGPGRPRPSPGPSQQKVLCRGERPGGQEGKWQPRTGPPGHRGPERFQGSHGAATRREAEVQEDGSQEQPWHRRPLSTHTPVRQAPPGGQVPGYQLSPPGSRDRRQQLGGHILTWSFQGDHRGPPVDAGPGSLSFLPLTGFQA